VGFGGGDHRFMWDEGGSGVAGNAVRGNGIGMAS
jgi:hypothetical protein